MEGKMLDSKVYSPLLQGDYGVNSLLEPNTNCGGLVEDLGGSIRMVNMVPVGAKSFDCVWLIQPPKYYFSMNGNLYLKVNTLIGFDYAELEIREGLTSEGPLLEKILHSSGRNTKEHVTSPSLGFYVNLKAFFRPSSVLSMSFTFFHYNKCFTGPEFLCRNQRCIPRKVVCDGFDHCGDGTDEIEICYKDFSESRDPKRKWDSLTPNYYFPKTEHYSALKTATLVFVASSVGLILFLAVLILLLYRMGLQSRHHTEFENRLQTITEFLGDAEVEEIIDDEPPLYEAPPDYEAAMKEKADAFTERQLRVMEAGSQKIEINSNDGKVAATTPESVGDCLCGNTDEKFDEHKVLEKTINNGEYISVSPPPPYVEEGNESVMNCAFDSQCVCSSSSFDERPPSVTESGQNSKTGFTC
ncbi:UNVERIFIED_CONTAM: hypothetical protein PYX00_005078 [Menopon gallinae]|uniref:CUB domain-containing protein n=1 Tax=Menopon gallinae TaxID=328185 RepID=A0AAW2HQ09_9NEOP